MIILIDIEMAFDNLQHQFTIKSDNIRYIRNIVNIIKNINNGFVGTIKLKRLKLIHLSRGQ